MRIQVTATYEVNPQAYGDTKATPEEILKVDRLWFLNLLSNEIKRFSFMSKLVIKIEEVK